MGQLEVAVGASCFGMDDPLRNSFPGEMCKGFEQLGVLEESQASTVGVAKLAGSVIARERRAFCERIVRAFMGLLDCHGSRRHSINFKCKNG